MSKILTNDGLRDATIEEQAVIDARQKEWNDNKSVRQITEIRKIRNQKLYETDWLVISNKISEAETTWRENLRNIPQDFSEDKYDELLARDEQGNLTHTVWSKP